ncbi:SusD family [Sphingobacterium spiritivorum]|uniref:SusD family n=1 Tax=Sphingobacterium spiritivorum TaxID=258 RepID=A0A380BKA9_SPHSI|nr:RagB/SusD family nutrient uptake outer membrane protein [Sphingobacterium spiritivorum]SUJ02720.1 SusD family [Sphingobacterium spiritivorum]
MKFKNKYFFSLLIVSLFAMACNKWLDVKPQTEVSEAVLFENEQGFKDAMVGVYTQLGSRTLYGKEFTMGFIDVLAQNYSIYLNDHNYYQAVTYNYLDAGIRDKINSFWKDSYKSIANINNLLRQIDQKKNVFAGNNYQIIKGEALALRAFLHFDLLRTFGPVPVGNPEGIAIPYVREFDMNVKPKLTLRQVTDECLIDLNEASKLLGSDKKVYTAVADIYRSFTNNHMNYWATTGLMARIYLYRGEELMAYQKAKEVIDAKMFPFVTSAEISSSTYPNRTFSREHLFGLYVANLQNINAELFKASADKSILTNSTYFINSRFEITSGGSTDYRYVFLWKTDGPSAAKYPVKYWSDDIQATSLSTNIKRVPLIRLSEMYYICAETSTDNKEKIDFLNEVRRNRGLAALSKTLNPEAIENEIFKEYKKEFYQEGQLFFYCKRKNKIQIDEYGPEVDDKVYVLPLPDDESEFTIQ